MIEGSAITVLDDPEQSGDNCNSDGEIVSFDLSVADKKVPFRISITAKRAKLADIVPPARTIADKLILAFLETLAQNGQSISCRKGCSACCRYLIPLSVPEIFRFREELLAMPKDKGSRILKSCAVAAKRILDESSESLDADIITKNNLDQTDHLSKWYAGLKLPCPFLSEGLCELYEQRPLACRQHIVTGSSFFCHPDNRGKPDVIAMPVNVLEAVGQLTAELENSEIEALMLPLAFSWAQDNLRRAERTWPAVTMVKRFVEILELTALKESYFPALST